MELKSNFNKNINDSSFTTRCGRKGLTEDDVRNRIAKGEVNKIPSAPSRTIWQIVRANLFNIFTWLNIILALVCILAGSPKNAIFAGVIIVNSIIGIVQELSARKTLEKLSVLSMAHTKVLRSGNIKDISVEELVLNDIVYLDSGHQVLADCEVVECDELEVDESMLTGESDPVYKRVGDKILSGSFIVAGEGFAEVKKVGVNTYSSELAEEARKFKIINSELQSSINKIIKLLLWLIVPIGIILTSTQIIFSNTGWKSALLGTVSGIVGMIPEGLVLLTSATFIVSVVKLAKLNTLVQQLSATEVLARVDVLCVDKTGTITEGKLNLVDIENIGESNEGMINIALSSLVHSLPSKNPTQKAILERYSDYSTLGVLEKVPFSSGRKWGGVVLEDNNAWVLGAPEILLKDRYKIFSEKIENEAMKGRRVLLLGRVDQTSLKSGINVEVNEEALIYIEDVIKKEAPQVLKYFKEEGVDLRVISGDNPVTVSAVAMRAGLENWDKYIDARTLPKSVDELKCIVDNYTIFGRVTPHQKKDIIKALQAKGHVVAMTGDGVNDVLALKESDCGIAMANGSDATRAVAQLVLMDSDFGALPHVVEEGRKQINNLERVAELFLSKTVFFVCLAFIFSALMLPYPLLPIQSSLVGSCAIGIPAFFLALLPSKDRVESGFLRRILTTSIPNGVIMVTLTTIGYVVSYLSGAETEVSRSVALLIFAGISLIILVRLSFPITKFKFTLVVIMITCVILCYLTPIGRMVFNLSSLTIKDWIIAGALISLSWPLISITVNSVRMLFRKKSKMQVA